MSLCLVTGGAGFIGSHLTEALLREGHQVRVFDNLSTGCLANLVAVRAEIDLQIGDLTNRDSVREAMQQVDVVFHAAGDPSVGQSIVDPLTSQGVIAEGTLHVLMAAREAGVGRVVFTSSAQVYGGSRNRRLLEEDAPLPETPYAVATLAAEQYCHSFTRIYGLDTVRLRCFNVIGPRQPLRSQHSALVPQVAQAVLAGKRPVLFGDGLQGRDFVGIEDVVQSHLLAGWTPRAAGKVYNVATGKMTTPIEIVSLMNSSLGTALRPIHITGREADPVHLVGDTSLAEEDLGYCSCTSLHQSLNSCIDYYAAQRKGPKFLRYTRSVASTEMAGRA